VRDAAETWIPGHLLRRYRRFLADVKLPDGRVVTAHCPNSGSLLGCLGRGRPVWLTHRPSPRRRLAYTWEMVHDGRTWVGVNTHRTNRVAEAALRAGVVAGLGPAETLAREVRLGRHRIDFLGRFGSRPAWIEVKSVTLLLPDGRLGFPDAVTRRGTAHLRILERLARAGHVAAVLFVVQRGDGHAFRPAEEIDPAFAAALRRAAAAGVAVVAHRARVAPGAWVLGPPVPVELSAPEPGTGRAPTGDPG